MSNTTLDDQPTAQQTPQTDLESRIAARRMQLIKVLTGLKLDTRKEAAEARDKLKARLSELAHLVKWGIADGWASVGEPVAQKLQLWLAASAHQVPSGPATAAAAPASTAVSASAPLHTKADQS